MTRRVFLSALASGRKRPGGAAVRNLSAFVMLFVCTVPASAQDKPPLLFEPVAPKAGDVLRRGETCVRLNQPAMLADAVLICDLEGGKPMLFYGRSLHDTLTWWGPTRDADRPVAFVDVKRDGTVWVSAGGMRVLVLRPLPSGLWAAKHRK